jgi:DUF1680 family protein
VTVNGKTVKGVMAGRFHELRRAWRDGDVVEIAFDMGMWLEPLNAAHPEMVALMTGPLVLMPIGETAPLTRDDLLAVKRDGTDSWRVKEAKLKPFMAIGDETYRVYTQVIV